ncbi:hypothetical protein ACIQMV_08750 [Streptomyces sp. NPDC091412]|uniref:hypothetical protein n=1 Tax=Streptomyces sp. NPDC091412 TaxID=3366002 RepID=UPI00380C98D4
MADTTNTKDRSAAPAASPEGRSIRPVIEHALIDYGYSPETANAVIEMLIAEARAE